MAAIKFKHLILDNFMSYEHAELSLDNLGYTLINGINHNKEDNSASNGSGKSSLFSALCWCLTGETPSGNKQVENIYLSGKTSVKVLFSLDSHEYEIERTKTPSNLFFNVDGEDKSGKGIRDTSKIIEEYLPIISSSLINSVIILGQGLPKRFTNNSPSGRKEVLEKLSNSDFMIADIKSRIENRLATLQDTNNELLLEKNTIKSNIEFHTNDLNSKQKELEELLSVNLLEEIDHYHNVVYDFSLDLEALNYSYLECEKYLDELEKNIKSIENIKQCALDCAEVEDTSELESELVELKSQIKFQTKEIDRLNNITDTCPTCGQKLPDVILTDTSELEAELHHMETKLNLLEIDINKRKVTNSNKLALVANHYDELIRNINDDVKQASTNLTLNFNAMKQVLAYYTEAREVLVEFETRQNGLESSIVNIKASIEEYEESIAFLENKLVDIENNLEETLSRLDIVNKMKTIISRDFRGYLLNNVITYISNRVEVYSNKVFTTNKLRFELDGNNISISYDNKEYEALSGGEQQKVDIIIQLAIRDMLCKYLNFSSNILVLDEITDSLDSYSSQVMFNLISSELSDVESIYIISHHTDFEIPCDSEITVEKSSDKISRIV